MNKEFEKWMKEFYEENEWDEGWTRDNMRDAFEAGKFSNRVESPVLKKIAVEYKDGWIILLKQGDITISYPKSDVKQFIEDLTRALNGERLSRLH